METKLFMSVMQNLLATCWFFIMNMCGTGIKNIFCFIIYMLYNIIHICGTGLKNIFCFAIYRLSWNYNTNRNNI